jgi:predicted ATPase
MSERDLSGAVDTLVASELVHRRGTPPNATYTFKHALVQDAAYDSLLKRDRQDLHRRIAEALIDRFPTVVETEPELLAHHYTAASLTEKAVPYWLKAGQHALHRSALSEAVRHLRHGLELLLNLPSGATRDAQELRFQSGLGTACLAFKGWASPEAGAAYTRAVELARHTTTDPKVRLSVFWGLFAFNLVRGDMPATRANVEELLAVAQQVDDPELLLVAKMAQADGAYWWSEFDTMRSALHDLYRRYEPQRHGTLVNDLNHDPKTISQLYEAQALWVQGYPDQAVRRCEEERALSRHIGHPFNLCFSLTWGALPYVFCKDVKSFLGRLEEGLVIARDQRLGALVAWGPWFEGWALAHQGQLAEGIGRMREGIAGWHGVGAGLAMPYCRTFLAEFLGLAGFPEEGLEEIAKVEAQIGRWGEAVAEAEAQRVKGELLLKRTPPDATAAEACFLQALDTARSRDARSWELRASMSLARLWQSQERRQEACDLLVPVYGWFTEGFDTADLKEAKTLLDDLK